MYGKVTDLGFQNHTITMEQTRILKVSVHDIHEEKVTILALVIAKPLDSNVKPTEYILKKGSYYKDGANLCDLNQLL
jgi:hypothetical protein